MRILKSVLHKSDVTETLSDDFSFSSFLYIFSTSFYAFFYSWSFLRKCWSVIRLAITPLKVLGQSINPKASLGPIDLLSGIVRDVNSLHFYPQSESALSFLHSSSAQKEPLCIRERLSFTLTLQKTSLWDFS